MNQERLLKVLRGAHVTEKSTILAERDNQVVFRIDTTATKLEVKKAVEMLFEVEVDQVRVVNINGKKKRHGRFQGKRADFKKAYVSLKPGFDINFAGVE